MSQLSVTGRDVTSVSVANDLWPNELGELCYVAPKIANRAKPALRGRLRPDAHARSGALCFACGAGGGACGRRKSIRRGTLGREQSPRPLPDSPTTAGFDTVVSDVLRTSARRSEAAPTWYLCKTWPVWREERDLWTRCPEDTAVARVGRGGSENSNCPSSRAAFPASDGHGRATEAVLVDRVCGSYARYDVAGLFG